MIHINSGMSGIARYNAWGAVILIFAVVLFFDEILMEQRTRKVTLASLSFGVFLTTLIVLVYGPHYAERTSA
jgi:asparagine N-glycosylation enzyme membrane subunit Stt3